ncbi:MAG: peptidase C14 caspase catalytic subunit p20, partial [SAR324 cluster bacterium]|nr:peptidase C14 caspase catalytic subunit p20 [SAR324 cluster bacterium]
MKLLKKLFVSEEPDKQIYEILERGKSLLEKNFFDWAAVEFNKAMELNPELATETVTKLFQEIQGGGNPDAIISLGINILQADPENIELANLIGNAYRKKHDWKRAENMYKHCLKYDAENNFAIYNLAAAMAKVEVQDGMAVSAIKDFEKMSDFVLPDVKEGIENLIDMQQHFAEEKDETDHEKKSEEIQEKEDTKLPENLDASGETNQSDEIKETKEKSEEKSSVNVETKDQKEENQPESSSIDPLKTFNYITSSLEKESTEEGNALFTLGIYCLQHNEANFAQRTFKRLLMRD